MNLDVAERLARMRRRRGLSQGELARTLGLSRQAISKWERGESSPDTDNLIALADLYGVTLDELVRPQDAPAHAQAVGDASMSCEPRASEGEGGEAPSERAGDVPTERDGEPAEGSVEAVQTGRAAHAVGLPAQPSVALQPLEPPARPSAARRWTRRGFIGLGFVAAFGLGAFAATRESIPFSGGHLELKSGIKRLLGRPEAVERAFNTANFETLLVEWPTGTVEFVSTLSDFPLVVQERSATGAMAANCEIKDGTFHVWCGDARGWDDPAQGGNDLRIFLPQPVSKDERGRDVAGVSFDTLTLNTRAATFRVGGIGVRRLSATLRDGALTDVPDVPEGAMPAENKLRTEELELDVGAGQVHVQAGSRSFKLKLNGGSVHARLADSAARAGEDFAAQIAIESGLCCVRQPNEAEGCTVDLAFVGVGNGGGEGEARFATALAGLDRDAGSSAYRFAGDPSLQAAPGSLVRAPDDIRYDVALASGSFELYGSQWWLTDVEEPAREKAVTVDSRDAV